MNPKVKRVMDIPRTPKESKTPYKDLVVLLELKAQQFLERQKNK